MNKDLDRLDYTDSVTDLLMSVNQNSARDIALDLWKYYPKETAYLYAALTQTQHTKKIAKLLTKDEWLC